MQIYASQRSRQCEALRKSLESMASFKIIALVINTITSCFYLVHDLSTYLGHGRLNLVAGDPAIKLHSGYALFS